MATEDSHSMYTLIGKYLSGEANNEEKSSLQAWIAASAENRSEFEQLEKMWLLSGASKSYQTQNLDVDLAWEKVQHKIDAQETPLKLIKSEYSKPKISTVLIKIAAFFVLAMTVYLIYLLSSGVFLQQNTFASEGEILSDTLPDNSIVTLNKYSQIAYQKEFKGSQRLLKLNGEAFFEVEPDPSREFVVQIEAAEVIVLGTAFNVNAYDSLDHIQVAVEHGKVKVKTQNDSVLLLAGETARIDKATAELSKNFIFEKELLFWKSTKLVFKNQSLEKVFESLKVRYGLRIELSNPNILNCRLTAKFEEEKIEEILEIIAANFNLKIEKIDELHFNIKGEGCEQI